MKNNNHIAVLNSMLLYNGNAIDLAPQDIKPIKDLVTLIPGLQIEDAFNLGEFTPRMPMGPGDVVSAFTYDPADCAQPDGC